MLYLQIVICHAFLINTKILSLKKKSKTMHHTKKKNPRIKTFFFHILHLSSKLQSFRFNNKKNSKTELVPLIDNTNELIRKILRGPTPFLPILVIIIIFFFMGEKVSSGIWETCPKILGGYEYQNPPPPKWGLIYIYIYIYNCMYHIIIVIISKNIS